MSNKANDPVTVVTRTVRTVSYTYEGARMTAGSIKSFASNLKGDNVPDDAAVSWHELEFSSLEGYNHVLIVEYEL